jgi:hypothetical protein
MCLIKIDCGASLSDVGKIKKYANINTNSTQCQIICFEGSSKNLFVTAAEATT